MSTSTKEGIRERYHSILKHKEPSNTDDVRLFLSDLRGVLQPESDFLEIQCPLISLLCEGAAFSWGEPEQQSWDSIESSVTQKLTDQSIQPTEYDLISDSEVFEGEDKYVAGPLPKFPVAATRQSQDSRLAMFSAVYVESEEDEGGNGGVHMLPGDDTRNGIWSEATRTAQQDTHLDRQTYTRSPRHAKCTLMSHNPCSAPHYGLTAADLEGLNITLPVNNRVLVKNLNYAVDEAKMYDVFSICGKIASVQIIQDEEGNSCGVAIITFTNTQEAIQSIKMMKTATLYGRDLVTVQDLAGPVPTISNKLSPGLANVAGGLGENGEVAR